MQVASQEAAIRERAYAIWEAEGRPDGRDWEHWYRAAHEVLGAEARKTGRANATPKAKPRKTGTKARIRQALKSALS
jgi:hypothetical protein